MLFRWKPVAFFFLICYTSAQNVIEMKIVDEISNYGWNAAQSSNQNKLEPKVKRSPFSGPEHLKTLVGKCYTFLATDYKYEFCPFDNVTQHERSMRWNPYSGIVGIWKDWKIQNNTFVHMNMENGESCGDLHRQVNVILRCGRKNNLTSVQEPSKCHYQMEFQTPLVCHPDAMLVYPVLNDSMQLEWDQLEQDWHDQYITEKGYNKELNSIFVKAGLTLVKSPQNVETEGVKQFSDLDTCNLEYSKLKKDLDKL